MTKKTSRLPNKDNVDGNSNLKMNSLPRMFKIDQTRYNNYYKNYINSCKNKNKELSQVVFERLN